MLNKLRIRLTMIYILAAILLVGVVGASAYSLLFYYFMSSNDSALRYKMATIYTSLGAETPLELKENQLSWDEHQETDDDRENENETNTGTDSDDSTLFTSGIAYEGELTSIFVFPLDNSGNLLFNPNPFIPPMQPDIDAVASAIKNGSDIRTITTSGGKQIRLLTYSLPPRAGFEIIQLGKPFDNQIRLLTQFLTGLVVSGFSVILVLGFGSWWYAGKSLQSTQKAWELQQTFIANASHELRTPLTFIRASSEVALRQTRANTRQQKLMTDVMSECDHMAHLVDDLLLISKLDTRQLPLDKEVISLSDLILEVCHQFQPMVEKQNIQLTTENLMGNVKGDRTRIRQVLIILVDNALQYTRQNGQITISTELVTRGIKVSVKDNGIGIPAEKLAHVFERFYQVRQDINAENRGNGLGLSIAKSLVEAHDGKISITSSPLKGTTVSFILPVINSH